MKTATIFMTALFTLTTMLLFAQPANNDFANAFNVSSIINSCSGNAAYTTKKAIMDKNQPSCSNTSGYNVWFKFQATPTTINTKVERGGNKENIKRLKIAVMESDGITQVGCNEYVATYDDVITSNSGLTNEDDFMDNIQVIDQTGPLVWNKIQNNEVYSIDINLNKLSQGIYIIQVLRDNSRIYHEEILKR